MCNTICSTERKETEMAKIKVVYEDSDEKVRLYGKREPEVFELAYSTFDLDGFIACAVENFKRNDEGEWLMGEDDYRWWADFAARQNRIELAYSKVQDDDDMRRKVAMSVAEDYEQSQRNVCEALGIPYDRDRHGCVEVNGTRFAVDGICDDGTLVIQRWISAERDGKPYGMALCLEPAGRLHAYDLVWKAYCRDGASDDAPAFCRKLESYDFGDGADPKTGVDGFWESWDAVSGNWDEIEEAAESNGIDISGIDVD